MEGPLALERPRPGGLANQKAPRIQAILAQLADSEQGLDLEWLSQLEPAEAMSFRSWSTGIRAVDHAERRTRARTCTVARNSGCILRRRIFCRDFANRSSA